MKKKAVITTLIFIIFLVFVFLLTKNISAETQTSTKSEKKSQAYELAPAVVLVNGRVYRS